MDVSSRGVAPSCGWVGDCVEGKGKERMVSIHSKDGIVSLLVWACKRGQDRAACLRLVPCFVHATSSTPCAGQPASSPSSSPAKEKNALGVQD